MMGGCGQQRKGGVWWVWSEKERCMMGVVSKGKMVYNGCGQRSGV